MEGDNVLAGATEDGVTCIFMFYSYVLRKLVVIVVHDVIGDGNYVEDMPRHFESDSRAKAEHQASLLCREFDIPYLDEYTFTKTELPLDQMELSAWVNPALPYLN